MSEIVPSAPYTSQASWLDHSGAHLAVHGDDVAIDRIGQDSLTEMKAAKRFSHVQRFKGPGSISTTDLIDRMLHATVDHHLPQNILTEVQCKLNSSKMTDMKLPEKLEMLENVKLFSRNGDSSNNSIAVFEISEKESFCVMTKIVEGCVPFKEQRVIYIDGAFDLFTAGHISLLEAVVSVEKMQHSGLEPFLIVGIYDDMIVSKYKGLKWPVMNTVERALLLLQNRVSLKKSFHV